ncbi:MAG: OadG family protein [Eubacterium sp.]|nr:OadG family protein [Eubacterium sp.]
MDLYSLSTSIIPDTSVEFTATLIIAGLSVVLGVLALLIAVVKIYGIIVTKLQGVSMRKHKKKSNTAPPEINIVNTPPPAPEKPAAPAVQGVSEEIVAAISAAVYMMEGEGAVVTSIAPAPAAARRQAPNPITRRNPWAFAAVTENTRPF